MYKVFIDGKEGTTGIQIFDRLGKRNDVEVITLPEELRKNVNARKECLNAADICFLCLPDAAAKEAVSLIDNPSVRVIDASTAHRTNICWVYGLPELSNKRREEIANAKRVANPGCHATGFITLVYPLVKGGIISPDYPLSATSITGYSGAGKKTIVVYESVDRPNELNSPRHYALTQKHKHLPEITQQCGLNYDPIFNPIICDFYSGMCVSIPLHTRFLDKKYTLNDIKRYMLDFYCGQKFIKVVQDSDEIAFLPTNNLSGTNKLNIIVSGNDERIVLYSVFDNLGKGASGAAVQNMNIMLGLDETKFLI